jgi:hypothetical protein
VDGFRERPNASQTAIASARVESLHLQFGILAQPVTTTALQDEWRKSVNALVYLLVAAAGRAPHERYDGYFDYATPDAVSIIEEMGRGEREAMSTVERACRIAVAAMEDERERSRLFRFSFVSEDHRGAEEITRSYGAIRRGGHGASSVPFDVRRRVVRLRVMEEMTSQLRRALRDVPEVLREALALGLDDLARARSAVPER